MDIRLPDMDGTELCRMLKAADAADADSDRRAHFAGDEGRPRAFLADGFDGYLEKPISIREFPDQIRRYCLRASR